MTKIFKRTIILILFIALGLVLIGCGETPSTDNPGGNQGENQGGENQGGENQGGENQGGETATHTIASVGEALRGTYKAEDIVVVVEETKVSITDSTGKTLQYILYVESDGRIYILEDEEKVYCTFGENTVTNKHGTFIKETIQPVNKIAITFELTVPALDKTDYEFVIKGSFSNWKCLAANKLTKDGDKYIVTLEFEEGKNIEYKYAIFDEENGSGVAEVMLDGKDIANRVVNVNEEKTVQDTVARFKGIKLASEVEQVKELLDNTFYDNDKGSVHQLAFDNETGKLTVTYTKAEGKNWSCIIRPFTSEESGLLSSITFKFKGEKGVEYLFKVEGGDGNQEEAVVGTGEVQEYTMKISESAVNSARLVIFGHKGLTGTTAAPVTGTYELISIKAVLKEPVPETERVPGENPIHILAIGNSFSDDGLWLLYDILEQLGYDDIIVANLYIGGCTVAIHKSNLENDASAYTYRINKDGTWNNKNGYKASKALAEQRWDYISLQQASDHSGLVDKYVEADINYIYEYALNIAKEKNPDVKFVWHMTWAYQQNSTHSAFVNYNKDQLTMYNGILNAVQTVIVPNSHNPIVVPSGTTIQNLRTTFLGDTITRDGYHLNEAFGRYAAALTWAIKLTGKDIDNIVRPASVSAKYDPLCKEAAKNACLAPFEITNSIYTEDNNQVVINYDNYDLLPHSEYIVGNGYYNSQDSTKFLTRINDGSDFCNGFITTKLLTKEDLPIGSIIALGNGYQYRPEGWIDEAKQTSRNPNTTEAVIVVDEAWWGNYIYRAFNISKVGGGVLTGEAYDAALANFNIYIPKE